MHSGGTKSAELPLAVAPFLRWMGSKRRDATLIAEMLSGPETGYSEPFVGSGAVFLAGSFGTGSVLSDSNAILIETYRAIRDRHEEVSDDLDALSLAPVESTFKHLRSELSLDQRAVASRFLYLNAHCFNGLYRTNRSGGFNVPLGRRAGRVPTREHLEDVSAKLQGVELLVADGRVQIASAEADHSLYVDPPYITGRPSYGEYGYHDYDEPHDDLVAGAVGQASDRGVRCVATVGSLSGGWKKLRVGFTVWERERASAIGGNRSGAARVREYLLTNIEDCDDQLSAFGWEASEGGA